MPEPDSNLEVEWQFAAGDLSAVLAWLRAAKVPGYRVAPGDVRHLHDTYYDTSDWRVHRAGYTCRVREKKKGEWELTLKSMAAAVDSLRSRTELNEPLAPEATHELLAAPGRCGQLLRLIAGPRPLRPIFALSTTRTTFDLEDDDGRLGEIAADETTIPVVEDHPARLTRVEVEVAAGAVGRASRFVDLLVATAGLRPAGTSKFEAALAASGLSVTSPADGLGTDEVLPDMASAEAAFAILRRQFRVFVRNEPGTRIGDDIEALHDMRVATRRMRAAMSAFASFLPPRLEWFRSELGWVAAGLGAVRDLDVQLERMSEWRETAGPERAAALAGIETLLVARRDGARKRLLVQLNSRRYERIVDRFAALLRTGPPPRFAPGREPLLSVAPDLVEKRYRRVRRRGDPIRGASPPERYHELRIEAKKLRYALEFVGSVYGRPAITFSQRVAALQDVLGLHQDAYVAIAELEEMAATSARRLGPPALLAMGAIAERYRLHAQELRGQFPRVFQPIAGPEWRRLQKLMDSRKAAAGKPAREAAGSPAQRRRAPLSLTEVGGRPKS